MPECACWYWEMIPGARCQMRLRSQIHRLIAERDKRKWQVAYDRLLHDAKLHDAKLHAKLHDAAIIARVFSEMHLVGGVWRTILDAAVAQDVDAAEVLNFGACPNLGYLDSDGLSSCILRTMCDPWGGSRQSRRNVHEMELAGGLPVAYYKEATQYVGVSTLQEWHRYHGRRGVVRVAWMHAVLRTTSVQAHHRGHPSQPDS